MKDMMFRCDPGSGAAAADAIIIAAIIIAARCVGYVWALAAAHGGSAVGAGARTWASVRHQARGFITPCGVQ